MVVDTVGRTGSGECQSPGDKTPSQGPGSGGSAEPVRSPRAEGVWLVEGGGNVQAASARTRPPAPARPPAPWRLRVSGAFQAVAGPGALGFLRQMCLLLLPSPQGLPPSRWERMKRALTVRTPRHPQARPCRPGAPLSPSPGAPPVWAPTLPRTFSIIRQPGPPASSARPSQSPGVEVPPKGARSVAAETKRPSLVAASEGRADWGAPRLSARKGLRPRTFAPSPKQTPRVLPPHGGRPCRPRAHSPGRPRGPARRSGPRLAALGLSLGHAHRKTLGRSRLPVKPGRWAPT